MTIELNRSPRGRVVDAINQILNPGFEVSTQYWSVLTYGVGATGAFEAGPSAGDVELGLRLSQLRWTKGQDAPTPGVGIAYLDTTWKAADTRTFGLRMNSRDTQQDASIVVNFLNASGGLISQVGGPVVHLNVNQWTNVSVTATAPAGTTQASIGATLIGGSSAPKILAGHRLLFDGAGLFGGTAATIPAYFTGDSPAAGDYTYAWEGTPGLSRSFRFISDPATAVRPLQLADRVQYGLLSRNTIHTLMSGLTAATLMQGTMRSGILKLLFETEAAAYNCAAKHTELGTWGFTDDENPYSAMIYATTGGGTISVYQDETRTLWIVEIPFSELPA